MAVDRGGLNYGISVRDEFSANTEKFISGIRRAKDEFAAFRAEVSQGKGAAAAVRELARASEQAARAGKRAAGEQSAALQRLAQASRRQAALERESTRIRNTQARDAARNATLQVQAEQRRLRAIVAADRAREQSSRRILAAMRRDEAAFQKQQIARLQETARQQALIERQRLALSRAAAQERARLDRLNPEVQGARRADNLIQQRETAKAQIAALRARGREDLITNQLKRQAGELRDSARSANSLLFTFRRLVGVLAVFQLARALVSGFRDLIISGIRFNDQIEQAEIGIAGLITGLADLRNEQGNTVELAEEYARAQVEARKQVALLRQDALLTTATFEQLLDTFQIAIGPGFAAGLNLNQIRKLSVSISQAATAIGLPQNQLAEEIRSLLSGTIQARTTRIATTLQITNADIRRLRQTGELFDFLDKKFKALGVAAELAARQTLNGIGNLVKDALQAILGQAAQPLFEELIRLGQEVFDQVLTIKTAANGIQPRPEAVQAFRALFDALRQGVVQARELGRQLGFQGVQDVLRTLGAGLSAGLQFAIGFAQTLTVALRGVLEILRSIGNAIGLDVNDGLSDAARFVGRATAGMFLFRTAANLTGFSIKDLLKNILAMVQGIRGLSPALRETLSLVGKGGLLALGVLAVGKGFETWLESIFDVNLSLTETVALITIGLQGQLDKVVTKFDQFVVTSAGALKRLFTFDDAADAEIQARVDALNAALEQGSEQAQAKLDQQIAEIVNKARKAAGQIAAIDRPAEDKGIGTDDFAANVSNVESIVAKVGQAIGEVEKELQKLGAEFDAAGKKAGKSGFAGEVEDAFGDAAVASAEQARDVIEGLSKAEEERLALVQKLGISEQRLAAIRQAALAPASLRQSALDALELTRAEGQLVSILRNEEILREAIGEVEGRNLEVARLKVAIAAREDLPALRRELDGLREQATAEQAIALATTSRLGARRLAAIQAQNELAAQRQQSRERIRDLREQAEDARRAAAPITGQNSAEERAQEKARAAAATALAIELEKQLGLELLIADAKEKQLAFAAEQARLAAEGTFTAGVRAGFEQLANDLPTLFDAAKNIVTGITQSFISSAGQLFAQLFDPRVQADAGVALGEFLLNAGQLIFEQTLGTLIQSLISSAVGAQAVEITAATTAASIKQAAAVLAADTEIGAATAAAAIRAGSGAVAGGVYKGGLVPAGGFAAGGRVPRRRQKARGYAKGGRPRGLDPRDTVPAWLQPGEFVIRKAVVDSMGADFFRSVNSGDFSTPSAPPSGEGSVGMIRGGVVPNTTPARSSGGGQMTVLPVQVTSEREMDRLQAGGKNAMLRFIRENRGSVRAILEG